MDSGRGMKNALIGSCGLIAGGALLAAGAAFPLIFVPLSLFAAPMLSLSRRLHPVLPSAAVVAAAAVALPLNFDVLSLLCFSVLAVGTALPVVIGRQGYILSGAASLTAGALTPLALCIIVCAVAGVRPAEFARSYVLGHGDSYVIAGAADEFFSSLDTAEPKPEPGTEEYRARALKAYGDYIKLTMSTDLAYHLTNYGGLLSLLLCFCRMYLRRRESCRRRDSQRILQAVSLEGADIVSAALYAMRAATDSGREPEAARDGVAGRPDGGGTEGETEFADMRLGRAFLWRVFLPVLIFSLFGLFPMMQSVVATVFNLTVFLPCAFEGFFLALYIARLCGKKPGTALTIIFCAAAAAALIVPVILLIFSVFGFTDSLMNMRKLFDIVGRRTD